MLRTGKVTSFGVAVGTISLILVLCILFKGSLGRPSRVIFVIKDRIFIVGRRRQLLILLVEERYSVNRVSRHCLVLVIMIEINPATILLRWRNLLLRLLQRHIRLAFLNLMEELRPFILAMHLRLPILMNSTSSSTSLLLVDCIWRVTLLTYWWRACLQYRYCIFLSSAMQRLVSCGLDADGILWKISMSGETESTSFIHLWFFRYTAGQLITQLWTLQHPTFARPLLRCGARHLIAAGFIEKSCHVHSRFWTELLLPSTRLILRIVVIARLVLRNLGTSY